MDLAEAHVAALNYLFDHEPNVLNLNIGTGKELTIKQYAEFIMKRLGLKFQIKFDKKYPDGTPRKLLDVSRLSKLGWKPKINLEKGIEMTIESFKKEIESGVCRI